MLVLTRKRGEEILIGDNIKLIVNRIAGNRVTLAINAPDNVTILRGELEPATVHGDDSPPQDNQQSFCIGHGSQLDVN
ncbi:MAG TPA: carbon storage regulator [Candidatus Anammoximicrobium sp.]|nr:carbon storage regulator [Candidatus Anammoximicrobium sp.]